MMVSDKMQCYLCSGIYNDYLDYCPYCGVKKEKFNVCSNCSKKLKKNIQECPECSAKPVSEKDEMKSKRLIREALMHSMPSKPDEYYNEAIRFNRHNSEAWVKKAEYFNAYANHKTVKCCDAGLKIHRDNAEILFVKAKALKDKDSESSQKIFDNLLKRCNRDIQENKLTEEAWILKGKILSEFNENKHAIECYSKALEINPENEELLVKKALLHSIEYDHYSEIDCYKKAIEVNPLNYEYNEKIGDIYHIWIEDDENAVRYYAEALKINPENRYLWNKKGKLEKELGKYEDALESFTSKAELSPDENTIISKAEILCKLKRFSQAIECYDKFSTPECLNLKAQALIKLEKYDEALKVYDECILKNPDYDKTYLNKGKFLHKLGRWHEEIECYNLLLNKDEYNYHTYKKAQVLKAAALLKTDRNTADKYLSELLDECNDSLEKFPGNAPGLERKTDILYLSGNLKEALEYCNKLLERNDIYDRKYTLSLKGRILYEMKDYRKAIECFDKALEISDYPYALQYKGYCLEKLNKYSEAMECYEKCLEIEPENKEIELRKSKIEKK